MRRTTEDLLKEVEEDLLIAAKLFDEYGESLQPILDRLEAEYKRLREPSATVRVKAMLAEHHAEAGRDPA